VKPGVEDAGESLVEVVADRSDHLSCIRKSVPRNDELVGLLVMQDSVCGLAKNGGRDHSRDEAAHRRVSDECDADVTIADIWRIEVLKRGEEVLEPPALPL
jgi:hypothetical protein